ncbi:hypothetical protein [Pontibacter vulgaris]|uniref:hypothetical protein n=1 Tax=Pontibacter vulgaris TaxID=2905679 RepID=UPI001FA81430|nr:hypothetical protein [Pontibacter vulgaris]
MESMYIYAFGRQLNQLKEQLDQQNTKQNNCVKNICQETNQLSQQGACCTRKPVATNL